MAKTFGFPLAGMVAGEGEHLGPGEQVEGWHDQGAPDPVLVEAVRGQVAQAGVLGASDPAFAVGAAPVAQFEVGELASDAVGSARAQVRAARAAGAVRVARRP